MDVYHGQKTFASVISVAHKFICLKQIFTEAYGFVLRKKKLLVSFFRNFPVLSEG